MYLSRYRYRRTVLSPSIKFVMNRLNNQDPDTFDEDGNVKEYRETEVEYVAQIINQFIQELKVNYPALNERVNLKYIDPLESFDDSLQPCWITYEVWFREESIYATRWLRQTYIVFPPYTNHSDQEKEHNINGHTNYDHPELHNDHSKYLENIPGITPEQEDEYNAGMNQDENTDITEENDFNNGRLSDADTGSTLTPGDSTLSEEYEDYLYLIDQNIDSDGTDS